MKLLTTLAALLFSFTAFSQDYIEYRDFKFYQNGSEISFEEVTELTKEFGVAQFAFRQGKRDYAASENKTLAIGRNIIHGAIAFSAGTGAMVVVGAGILNITGGWPATNPDPVYGAILVALGSIPTGIMIHNARLLSTKKKFRERADKKFNKTAQKLNEAIQLVNSK
jgi:hypothetical protein